MNRYPKTLTHPNARKSVITPVDGADSGSGKKFRDYHGTPDVFPPVTVSNEDQEERHRAMGYVASAEEIIVSGYKEFPMWLTHPEGFPAKPPLLVNSSAEREEREAEGYGPPGKPNPEAVQAAISAPYDPSRKTEEFPKMVNGQVVDPDAADRGKPIQYPKWIGNVIVNSAEEEAGLLSESKPTESIGDSAMVPPVDPRIALRAQAEALGIVFDGRWSAEKLRAAIATGG